MVKARVTLPTGVNISIEGPTDEVSRLVRLLTEPASKSSTIATRELPIKKKTKVSDYRGPTSYLRTLIDEGFFNDKRTIADVKKYLEGQGHFYRQEDLSPVLLRLVRSRSLRRIKEGKIWKYVNP